MKSLCSSIYRLARFVLVALVSLSLAATGSQSACAAEQTTEALTLVETPGVFVIEFSGRSGRLGIPSWRIELQQRDAGNVSMRVPADSEHPLGVRPQSQWPLGAVLCKVDEKLSSSMSRGRESFAQSMIETFEVVERANDRIVVSTGGVSPNKHFELGRVYTFTPVGVKIEGTIRAVTDLESVAVWNLFDRTRFADSHLSAVPVRKQGQHGWAAMASSGRDTDTLLPDRTAYPLEVELRLRQPEPTFVRIFVDKPFERVAKNKIFTHNNKDYPDNGERRYEKILAMRGDALASGQSVAFQLRFEFELQRWP